MRRQIRKGVINSNTDFTAYAFHCSSCSKQYVESNIIDFRCRFNNFRIAFRKVSKSGKRPKDIQEHFHKLPEHNGIVNWKVILIDRNDDKKELRRQEYF